MPTCLSCGNFSREFTFEADSQTWACPHCGVYHPTEEYLQLVPINLRKAFAEKNVYPKLEAAGFPAITLTDKESSRNVDRSQDEPVLGGRVSLQKDTNESGGSPAPLTKTKPVMEQDETDLEEVTPRGGEIVCFMCWDPYHGVRRANTPPSCKTPDCQCVGEWRASYRIVWHRGNAALKFIVDTESARTKESPQQVIERLVTESATTVRYLEAKQVPRDLTIKVLTKPEPPTKRKTKNFRISISGTTITIQPTPKGKKPQ